MYSKSKYLMITCSLAAFISVLFFLEALQAGFSLYAIFIIAGNLLYIPGIIIFKRKYFLWWSAAYCIILMFAASQSHATLFNNFTPLFVIFTLYMVKPNYKIHYLIFYTVIFTAFMIIKNESIIHYLQHFTRAAWIFYVADYVIYSKYERRELDLTEDEKTILEELNEKKLLKACTSFSKNTLTQKLKDARERNNIPTNAELLAEYNLTKK